MSSNLSGHATLNPELKSWILLCKFYYLDLSPAHFEDQLDQLLPGWHGMRSLWNAFKSILECEPDEVDTATLQAINSHIESLMLTNYTIASSPKSTALVSLPIAMDMEHFPLPSGPPPLPASQSANASPMDEIATPISSTLHSTMSIASADTISSSNTFLVKKLTLKEYSDRRKHQLARGPLPASAAMSLPSATTPDSNFAPIAVSECSLPAVVALACRDLAGLQSSAVSTAPAIRSFEGRIGSVFRNAGFFVTTPNMDVAYAPIPICKMWMHRLNNFSKDDPSYWLQPLHCSIGHLSVIPIPSDLPTHPLRLAWYQPSDSDFVPIDSHGLVGTGSLASGL
ncbi:hypothetical protein GYMLUDRAFT_235941 [Collybiopsis luxurians FD-317 M1]|nr:hypothetical protein GYMLUDRAFT_235941 [Collybiopsis luxurians FD-317 M1]